MEVLEHKTPAWPSAHLHDIHPVVKVVGFPQSGRVERESHPFDKGFSRSKFGTAAGGAIVGEDLLDISDKLLHRGRRRKVGAELARIVAMPHAQASRAPSKTAEEVLHLLVSQVRELVARVDSTLDLYSLASLLDVKVVNSLAQAHLGPLIPLLLCSVE